MNLLKRVQPKLQLIQFLLLIFASLHARPARAQFLCQDLFKEHGVYSSIDAGYLRTVNDWEGKREKEAYAKLVGTEVEKNSLTSNAADSFKISDFFKAREFRTWFEAQHRMSRRLREAAPEPVAARVKLLSDPRLAFQTKLQAMRTARHSIDIAYYIVHNDASGLAFFHEIKAALRRGVNVRFVLDSAGSIGMAPHSELRALIDDAQKEAGFVLDLDGRPTSERAKVEIVLFNPLSSALVNLVRNAGRSMANLAIGMFGGAPLDMLAVSINRRSHDKILLIDGAFENRALAFIGGRNIGDEYSGLAVEGTYADLEVMMKPGTKLSTDLDTAAVTAASGSARNAVGTQMSEYFDTIYFHLGNKLLTRSLLGLVGGYKSELEKIDQAGLSVMRDHQTEAVSEEISAKTDAPAPGEGEISRDLLQDGWSDAQVDIVNTFHNLFRSRAARRLEVRDHRLQVKNSRALMARLEQLIVKEDQEIVIASPYLWLSEKQVRMLKSWLLKNPARKLTIVTNSVITNDNMLAQLLVDNVLGPSLMLDPGLTDESGKIIRRSVADQVQVYQYGHSDATQLGGNVEYNLLHMKGILLKGAKISVIGTFNNDPRSLLLNTEGAAVIQGGQLSSDFENVLNNAISKSHLWGSPEYHQIRSDPHLNFSQRLATEKSELFYRLLLKLHLSWLL